MKYFRNKKIFLPLLVFVSFFITLIFCNPIRSGVELQRQLLRANGLKTYKLKTKSGYLNYFQGGNGPIMILVHGYIAEAGNWYTVVPELKKKYTLVIPDLPGHGESDPQTDILTPENLLEGILELIIKKSGNEKVILVGNSLGGWVCLMASLEAGDRISHMVLENSAGLKTTLPERLLLPKDVQSAKELYQVLLGDESPHAPDFLYKDLIRYLGQKRFIHLFNSIGDQYFLDNRLGTIDFPVTLIWGANDTLFDLDYAERLRKEIPGSGLIVVKSTGHAMHFTKPEIFIEKLYERLN